MNSRKSAAEKLWLAEVGFYLQKLYFILWNNFIAKTQRSIWLTYYIPDTCPSSLRYCDWIPIIGSNLENKVIMQSNMSRTHIHCYVCSDSIRIKLFCKNKIQYKMSVIYWLFWPVHRLPGKTKTLPQKSLNRPLLHYYQHQSKTVFAPHAAPVRQASHL